MTRQIPPLAFAIGAASAQHLITRRQRPTRASAVAATAIAAPSLYFLIGSLDRFRRAGTTVDPRPGATANALVVTGPNARSRNPMYVGMAGLLIAHATSRRSVRALAPAALFAAWIDQVQIPVEESHLKTEFPTEFDSYAQNVRRWL